MARVRNHPGDRPGRPEGLYGSAACRPRAGIEPTSIDQLESFLKLIDTQGATDDELIDVVVEWIKDLRIDARASKLTEAVIAKARRG
jgi:hypothetical protein